MVEAGGPEPSVAELSAVEDRSGQVSATKISASQIRPLVRKVLGTSELWQHRERAVDALDAWGEDSSGLEGRRNPFLFCDSDLSADGSTAWLARPDCTEGYSEEPPF